MALAVTLSRASHGIHSPLVSVETHLSNGLPAFTIVGLPEAAVRESRDRVRSALLNSHFEFPAQRITVNLAPADLPKQGSRFDLAIAIGILAASGQLRCESLADYEFVAELALSGQLRAVRGLLPAIIACRQSGRELIAPASNRGDASLPVKTPVRLAEHLLAVCAHLNKTSALPLADIATAATDPQEQCQLADVKGQPVAKRGLEIAAAGGHNLLLVGPPGTGKTMLANRFSSLLPPLAESTAIEVAAIQSVAGIGHNAQRWRQAPFRCPHHCASAAAMVGGGGYPRPGEISLAHHGVLFLDELPEFQRRVLEMLREPLESGKITISRAAMQITYPAKFQLLAAMNPCPCGYLGDTERHCQCSPTQIARYRERLSGPLLDRIDLHIVVGRVPRSQLSQDSVAGNHQQLLQQRIAAARQRQVQRQGSLNRELGWDDITHARLIDGSTLQWFLEAGEKLAMSTRALHRVLKLALTISDLAQDQAGIRQEHLKEALAYRQLDTKR